MTDKNKSVSGIFRFVPFLKNRKKGDILSAGNNPIINAFVQDQIEKPRTFNSAISKQDEMYLFALRHFNGNIDRACTELLTTGKQSMDVIRQIIQWKFRGFDNLSNFIDFASGYGRLTRFLIQEISPRYIWVCDIYEDAVKFQREQFGVHGIVSVRNPEDFTVDKNFDSIFVASLFSHLSERQFAGWLRRLYELLSPEGLLIFSVHDVAVLPPHLKMEEKGILFINESESRSLNKSDYGTTYVTESFVSNIIRAITGKSCYYRKKRGLWWFQDIYIIPKNPNTDFGDLDLAPGPSGHVDRCALTNENEIRFEGWAVDFGTDMVIKDIQIIVDGNIVYRCLPSLDRPDIAGAFHDEKGLKSGFYCNIPRSVLRTSDIIIVKVTNSRNVEHVIRIGTLESILD
jgi:SAM-dependent methyltransferase